MIDWNTYLPRRNAIVLACGPAAIDWSPWFSASAVPADFDQHVLSVGEDVELRLYAAPNTTLSPLASEDSRFAGFVWGKLFDTEDGTLETASGAIFDALRSARLEALDSLGGLFVAIVADRQTGRLTLVTDCLGARPFFLRPEEPVLAGSSNALLLSQCLPGPKKAHMGAVSQYLSLGFNATSRSLIDGIDRLDPATVTSWDHQRPSTQLYGSRPTPHAAIGRHAMAEKVHATAQRSYAHWTGDSSRLAIAMSGGFDSRYLAALSTSADLSSGRPRYVHVANTPDETEYASMVADRLGIDLDILPVHGALDDNYGPEDLLHGRPDGFPITKNVCRLVARDTPGARILDGFLGDAVIKGQHDGIFGSEQEPERPDLIEAALGEITPPRAGIFRPDINRTLNSQAIEETKKFLQPYISSGHVITAISLYIRQRAYISNNYLKNLHESEPCIPFMDPKLVHMKRCHPYSDYGRELYEHLFSQYYPHLSDLGHNDDMHTAGTKQSCTNVERRWARHCILRFSKDNPGGILDRSKVLPRLAMAPYTARGMHVIRPSMFLAMLLEVCERYNVSLDWGALRRHCG